ncbi:MAG TPA: oligosaccharide flippase family protein, partial [Bacteroides graminisolvens]|nr:oligosaccharide flippase family protein [Bacteroides graminisolvens]
MSLIFENKSVAGVVWSAIERFSVQGIQFILGIVIARLINPSDYGLIAMLGIFLAIAQTFTDSGFSQALIQKKNRNETDFSTVFFFNFGISVVIFLLFCLGASGIASFYNEPKLELITRWVALNIILTALSIVQRTELTIKMDFKTQAKASLVSVVLSGILGVNLAWLGFGVW